MKQLLLLPTVLKLGQRQMSDGAVRPQFQKLKKLQKQYSQDDGIPIHLKGGTKDKILYQSTLVFAILGSLYGMKVIIWDMSIAHFLEN